MNTWSRPCRGSTHTAVRTTPRTGSPRCGSLCSATPRVPASLNRENVPGYVIEPLLEDPGQPAALLFAGEIRGQRVDIDRQPPFLPQVVPDILVGGNHMLLVDAEHAGQCGDEGQRLAIAMAIVDGLIGNERVGVP